MQGLAYASGYRSYPRMQGAGDGESLNERAAIGRVLKRARIVKGWNQTTTAEKASISQQILSKIERGDRKGVDLSQVTRLALALDMTLEGVLAEAAVLTPPAQVRSFEAAVRAQGYSFPGPENEPLKVRRRLQSGAWLLTGARSFPGARAYPVLPDERYARADQWLAVMAGDAPAIGIVDGMLLHCVDAEQIGYYPCTGDLVEVTRRRFDETEAEVSLRQVEVTRGAVLLWDRTDGGDAAPLALPESAAADGEPAITGLVIAAIRRLVA